MLRSIFAGLFAIVLTLGLGISSVSAKTVEVKLGTDAGMLAFEPSTVTISAGDTVKFVNNKLAPHNAVFDCLLYTSPSPRDYAASRMPSSA